MDEDIIDLASDNLIKHLPKQLNILKVVEECAELSEVLVKYVTKSEEFKPTLEKIVEEMGDTVFRIIVLSKLLDVQDEVQGRLEEKAQKLYDWTIEKFKE
jgi:NTP pyrophosphatase (non-canonical NTP hydrolase)